LSKQGPFPGATPRSWRHFRQRIPKKVCNSQKCLLLVKTQNLFQKTKSCSGVAKETNFIVLNVCLADSALQCKRRPTIYHASLNGFNHFLFDVKRRLIKTDSTYLRESKQVSKFFFNIFIAIEYNKVFLTFKCIEVGGTLPKSRNN